MEWLSCCRILILPFPVRCHHAGQVCRTMQVSYHASVSYHAITQGKCVIPFKCHTMQVSYHSSVVPCKCVVPCHHAGQVCHTIQVSYHASVVPFKCRTMQVCRTMPSRRASVSYHLSAIVDKKGFFNRDIKSRPLPIVLHSPPLVPTGTEILFLSISKFILTGKAVCHVLYV